MISGRRTARIIGFTVKALAVLLIFSVCGVIIWRMCSSGDPDSVSVLTPNPALCRAYEENGEDLTLQYQYQTTITLGDNNSGYFSVTQYVFCKIFYILGNHIGASGKECLCLGCKLCP